jgi:hypothetical protein
MYSKHTAEDHIRKLKHDGDLAQQLAQKDDYYDWTITCAFYYVVHCIEAYAHEKGKENELAEEIGVAESLHHKRERFVRRYLINQFGIYRRLYDSSRQSRYDPTYFEKISRIKGYHKRLLESARKLENLL